MDTLTALRISHVTRHDAPPQRSSGNSRGARGSGGNLPRRAERYAWVQGRKAEAAKRRILPRKVPAGIRGPAAAGAVGLAALGYGASRMRERKGREPGVMASRLATHRHHTVASQPSRPGVHQRFRNAQANRTQKRIGRMENRIRRLRGDDETEDYSPDQPRDQGGKFGKGGGRVGALKGQMQAARSNYRAARARLGPLGLDPGQRGAIVGSLVTGGINPIGGAIGAGIGSALGRGSVKREFRDLRQNKRAQMAVFRKKIREARRR